MGQGGAGEDQRIPASELRHAHHCLVRLQKTLTEATEAGADRASDGFEHGLDAMISAVDLELDEFQSLRAPGAAIDMDALTRLNIVSSGFLDLKSGLLERAMATTSLGAHELWSSANLYRHLNLFEASVEGDSARPWIEALLFRTAAMLLQDDRRISLTVPASLPSRTAVDPFCLASFPGYIAAVVDKHCAGAIQTNPTYEVLKFHARSVVFILEAKLRPGDLNAAIHNAVCELKKVIRGALTDGHKWIFLLLTFNATGEGAAYNHSGVCGRRLCKKVIRGALTDGHKWIFLLLTFNATGEGAAYKDSGVVKLHRTFGPDIDAVVSAPSADVIAGILLHWITNGFSDVGADDWFEEYRIALKGCVSSQGDIGRQGRYLAHRAVVES
ncbi:hypothetical protein BJ912DRAFT_932919 [Pholiota molesta]|nr:hypothetical protein BJ912DRAFT_932919 [Pholiota molesta]